MIPSLNTSDFGSYRMSTDYRNGDDWVQRRCRPGRPWLVLLRSKVASKNHWWGQMTKWYRRRFLCPHLGHRLDKEVVYLCNRKCSGSNWWFGAWDFLED